jgi:hypothetical protein
MDVGSLVENHILYLRIRTLQCIADKKNWGFIERKKWFLQFSYEECCGAASFWSGFGSGSGKEYLYRPAPTPIFLQGTKVMTLMRPLRCFGSATLLTQVWC